MISTFAHVLGFMGMLCVVLAFHMTVSGRWSSQSRKYNVVNLIGAVLLIISLTIHFNLGSFVIEIFWIIISIRGILQSTKEQA